MRISDWSSDVCSSDLSGLLALFREQFQAQSVELDEARRILLVIGAGVVLEGDMALAVEAERRLAADDAGVALVKLEADGAGDVRLAMVDRRLQHLAFGREPEAVVDELGIFRHQLVLEVRGAAVER